jgi:tetratricopeptide (TPR) repeat protein
MTLRRHLAAPLPSPLVALLTMLRPRDRAVAIGGASAIALWLGRPARGPTTVLVSRSTRLPAALSADVELRRGCGHRVVLIDDVPVEGRLDALVRSLEARSRSRDARLLAEAARSLEEDELRQLARRARARCTPGVARAVYLVRASGRAPLRARPSSRPVWLRADGPRVGTLDEGSGVRVNAPDGIERSSTARPDWLDASLAHAPRGARSLLALACLGVGIDRALATHVLGPRGLDALVWLESSGLLEPEAERLVSVPPLGGADLDAPQADLASALAWLDAHRQPRRRAEGVDLRLRLGADGALARALEEASGLVERGEDERLERWLAVIEPSRPLEARRLRARALERRGLLHDALGVVREGLADTTRDAALTLERARLAWRVGNRDEAQAALRALARRASTLALQVEAEVLHATMASERGEPVEAKRHLERARSRAEQSGDGESLAQVLRRLGTLEARAGRPRQAAGAYRAALGALERVGKLRDASLETALVANLATMESWLGNLDEAERLYRVALERRSDRPIERLNTLAALALLSAARGEREPGGAFAPLLVEAERVGDPRLRAELAVYRVEELAADARLADAERALAVAHTALAELGGAEVVLEAMTETCEGLLRARRGEHDCHAIFARCIDTLASAGARYHAARSAREAAMAACWLGDEVRVVGFVERAFALSREGGFDLGHPARHVGALVVGALAGTADTRARAVAVLERVGPLRVAAWLQHQGRRDLATRWAEHRARASDRGAALVAFGPSGPRALSGVELEALRADPTVVLLDRVLHRLHRGGAAPRDLGRMRSVEPLLAHLAAVRPGAASVEELSRAVWAQRPSRSVRVAITTSIARLRRLLGSSLAIHTSGSGERRAYSVDATAPLWVLEVLRG